jgi:hypothetical protein
MKWRIDALYVKVMYVLVVIASLVAAAAADMKWR